jgi:hypothetical protein
LLDSEPGDYYALLKIEPSGEVVKARIAMQVFQQGVSRDPGDQSVVLFIGFI